MFDPLHEVAYMIFMELDASEITLRKNEAEITVLKKTKYVDVPSVLRKYGFDVSDCNLSEVALYSYNCIGVFDGQINGKKVNGLIIYDSDKKMVLYVRMSYQPEVVRYEQHQASQSDRLQ